MTPLKIGACCETSEIAAHRAWLFAKVRDIGIQGFTSHPGLTDAFEDRVAAPETAMSLSAKAFSRSASVRAHTDSALPWFEPHNTSCAGVMFRSPLWTNRK